MSSLDFCKKQPSLCISLFLSITCPLSLIIDEVCQTYEISENHQICKSFSTTHPHIRLIHKGGTQQVDTCSKLLIKNCITIREVTVVLSLFKLSNKDTRATPICIILVSLLITFRKLVSCFYLKFWTCIYFVWKFTYNPMFHYSHCRCISWRYTINTTDDLNKIITP